MSTYIGLLGVLVVAGAGVGATFLLWRLVALDPQLLTARAFMAGWDPQELALSRFHARWYPMTLLFLAFDVEMLFMYPWAVVVAEVGMSAVVEMFGFLAILMAGVVWAWREGALRWA